jgi:hypothetical protein
MDTTAASIGPKDVTIINPDGQSAIGRGILSTGSTPAFVSGKTSRR